MKKIAERIGVIQKERSMERFVGDFTDSFGKLEVVHGGLNLKRCSRLSRSSKLSLCGPTKGQIGTLFIDWKVWISHPNFLLLSLHQEGMQVSRSFNQEHHYIIACFVPVDKL